ncbi:MAG: AAA family ATPase [Clostridia bacterium]|nr:AAA family ATPase [Clostridia bacterium]
MNNTFALIGKNIGYSLSPEIHDNFGLKNYKLLDLNKSEFISFIKKRNFKGLNITTPYKEEVIKYLDEIDNLSKEIGAVNTVYLKNKKLIGTNTDAYGFIKLLEYNDISVKRKSITVLGSGGASKAVIYALKKTGAKRINIVSRSGKINYENVYSLCKNTQILINATPVKDKPLVNLENFKKLKAVIDLNYSPLNTPFILQAKKLKIKNANGLYMLVAQAEMANKLFVGKKNQSKKTNKIYDTLLRKNQNVILIGMPGAGKTTIAKKIAKDLHLPFYDTDYKFKNFYGHSTADEIINNGVIKYRKKETAVIKKMSTLKGCVIATGGGVFTIDKNREYLEKNAIVFFIKRKISKLDTSNRPLVKMSSPKELYKQRKHVYFDNCDYIINNKKIEKSVKEIKEILK